MIPPRIRLDKRNPDLKLIHEALHCAIFMASQIDNIDEQELFVRPSTVRASFFRACLLELCRVEYFLKQKIGKFSSYYKSTDPVFHIIKLLRNYQVHIGILELNSENVEVVHSKDLMLYKTFIIQSIKAEELKALESARGYDIDLLSKLIEWFDTEQKKLGIVQMLFNIIQYIENDVIHKFSKIGF